MLIIGEAVHMWGQRMYGNPLYFFTQFCCELKLLLKFFIVCVCLISLFFKAQDWCSLKLNIKPNPTGCWLPIQADFIGSPGHLRETKTTDWEKGGTLGQLCSLVVNGADPLMNHGWPWFKSSLRRLEKHAEHMCIHVTNIDRMEKWRRENCSMNMSHWELLSPSPTVSFPRFNGDLANLSLDPPISSLSASRPITAFKFLLWAKGSRVSLWGQSACVTHK